MSPRRPVTDDRKLTHIKAEDALLRPLVDARYVGRPADISALPLSLARPFPILSTTSKGCAGGPALAFVPNGSHWFWKDSYAKWVPQSAP
jgi:hypothetical protein